VRYTADELKEIIKVCQNTVEDLVTRKKIDFIWRLLEEQEYAWERLTKKIMEKIFGKDFFVPIEQLDNRIKLIARHDGEFERVLSILRGKRGNTYLSLIPKEKIKKVESKPAAPFLAVDQLFSMNELNPLKYQDLGNSVRLSFDFEPDFWKNIKRDSEINRVPTDNNNNNNNNPQINFDACMGGESIVGIERIGEDSPEVRTIEKKRSNLLL
jgi:hypothetical protein